MYYHYHFNLEQVISHAPVAKAATAAAAVNTSTILYWPFRIFVLQSDRERQMTVSLKPGKFDRYRSDIKCVYV